MAYTVKQVAAMSGVSVRTLHFYDEAELLKPAYVGSNGYRYYEEAELLRLQQILFYRELGLELRQIGKILGRRNFEKVSALKSHRKRLKAELERKRRLIETIDGTLLHLKGRKKMKSRQMFAGFRVAAGRARFGEQITLGGEPIDCKVSGRDTDGTMAVFEFSGSGGGPRHLHYDQDEWIYVVEGEFEFVVGNERFALGPGGCVFIPRNVEHIWGCANGGKGKVIDVYQPAGKMEEFFRDVTKPASGAPTREQMVNKTYTREQVKQLQAFFEAHGMDLLGPE